LTRRSAPPAGSSRYENKTCADGQAAAIYGQKPPLVKACQPPGDWQTYDILFESVGISQCGLQLKIQLRIWPRS